MSFLTNHTVVQVDSGSDRLIALFRILLSLFIGLTYHFLLDPDPEYRVMAYVIIAIGLVHGIATYIGSRFGQITLFRSSYATSFVDGIAIALWLVATGFLSSPYYPLWYLSIFLVAARYPVAETGASAIFYLLLYESILILDPDKGLTTLDVVVRMGFIPLSGMLGMYVSAIFKDKLKDRQQVIAAEMELKRMNEELEQRVRERTAELQVMHDDITDSINYANRIQHAILPDSRELDEYFTASTVVYLPKDIISGDFYWSHRYHDLTFVAVVDCTGHGVPGALMSMIGNNLLNQVIIEHRETDEGRILTEMDRELERLLKRDRSINYINDGMDMSLCIIDSKKKTLSFAGAQQSALFINKDGMRELESTKLTIGGLGTGEPKKFNVTTLDYTAGDRVYMLSDGFQDQFGGPKGKKFFRKNVIALIESLQVRPLAEHGHYLQKEFLAWKGQEMQMDDVTIVGLEL